VHGIGLVDAWAERRGLTGERCELAIQQGTDIGRDVEFDSSALSTDAALVDLTHEQSPSVSRAGRRPAADKRRLELPVLGLHPISRPHAGVVYRPSALGDYALIAVPERLLEQRPAIVEPELSATGFGTASRPAPRRGRRTACVGAIGRAGIAGRR
jgi:hypothetical protein